MNGLDVIEYCLKAFTFQYGYIQMSSWKSRPGKRRVYIPIWLYSNPERNTGEGAGSGFTFQYGYIQMTAGIVGNNLAPGFTFQYGYIQML